MLAALAVNLDDRSLLSGFIVDVELTPLQQSDELIPHGRLGEPSLQPSSRFGIASEYGDILPVLQTACEFELAKLNGLESAGRLQQVSKLDEVRRNHCLQDAQLGNEEPDNGGKTTD